MIAIGPLVLLVVVGVFVLAIAGIVYFVGNRGGAEPATGDYSPRPVDGVCPICAEAVEETVPRCPHCGERFL